MWSVHGLLGSQHVGVVCCGLMGNSQQLKSYLRFSLSLAMSPHMDPQDTRMSVVSPLRKSILVCARRFCWDVAVLGLCLCFMVRFTCSNHLASFKLSGGTCSLPMVD